MKLLLVHNEYGARSGEEVAFYNQVDALKSFYGEENVSTWIRTMEETPKSILNKARAFFSGMFSLKSAILVYRLVLLKKVDYVVFHNIYPWISISALIAAKLGGAKVFVQLHNFKHICPSSSLSFRGELYKKGLQGKPIRTVYDNVQGSRLKSIGYYLRFKSERFLRLENWVDKFIFVSDLQFKLYQQVNPRITSKGHIIPNFLSNEIIGIDVVQSKGNHSNQIHFCFVGRLTEEKGFKSFVELAKGKPNHMFHAIGHGDLTCFSELPKNIQFYKFLRQNELWHLMSSFDVLVVENKSIETFSFSALEALFLGLNVVVGKNIGICQWMDDFPNLYVLENIDLKDFVNLNEKELKEKKDKVEIPRKFTQVGFLESFNSLIEDKINGKNE